MQSLAALVDLYVVDTSTGECMLDVAILKNGVEQTSGLWRRSGASWVDIIAHEATNVGLK